MATVLVIENDAIRILLSDVSLEDVTDLLRPIAREKDLTD